MEVETMNTRTKIPLLTALVVGMSTFGAAPAHAVGTTNGNAGCVAQITAGEGTPGSSVGTIKLDVTPVPGQLFSAVARQDRSACELP
jgi:hypothetical protein